MTPKDIARFRLINQRIAGSKLNNLLAVTNHMGAMQAQDYYGTLWTLSVRTGLSQAGIEARLKTREIVRTWPQRGTLHVVSPLDAKWLVGLSADRLLHGARLRRERLGLSERILATSQQAIVEALSGGKLLTRSALMQVLEDASVNTKAGRGYHILWYLSQNGVTYIGPMSAKEQTIGLLDELVPHPKVVSREAALEELARRYFLSHGPATLQDFMWWSGLTSVDAKAGLAANTKLLTSQSVEGKDYWLPKSVNSGPVESAYLLAGFDEYLLGYKDRSAVLPKIYADKIVPGGNGMFLSTIVIDGQVVGTWKRKVKKDQLTIELLPFKKLKAFELKLLQKPAEDYGRFLSLTPNLQVA